MKIKKELYIFLISVFFTIVYDLYYLSNNFRDSVWDTFKRNFLEIENFLIGLIVVVIGYILFRFIFLITSLFLRKKDFVFKLKAVSISVFSCLLIYIVNDQLILNNVKDYEWIHHYEPVISNNIEIDSSNFFNYSWQIKAWDDDYLVNETINFKKDSILILNGERIVCDRFYLIRRFFNINHEYQIKGKWKYGNKTFSPLDSGDYPHSIEIKDNDLYLDTYF